MFLSGTEPSVCKSVGVGVSVKQRLSVFVSDSVSLSPSECGGVLPCVSMLSVCVYMCLRVSTNAFSWCVLQLERLCVCVYESGRQRPCAVASDCA